MLLLTPQGMDCCAPKLMSFLLLSIASGASSYLTLYVFSPLLFLNFPHLWNRGWSVWAMLILPCFCLLIDLLLCFPLTGMLLVSDGVFGALFECSQEWREEEGSITLTVFIACDSICHNYHSLIAMHLWWCIVSVVPSTEVWVYIFFCINIEISTKRATSGFASPFKCWLNIRFLYR